MSTMREVDRLRGAVLGLLAIVGCSTGVPGDTSVLTFGPSNSTSDTSSATTRPVDFTTGGLGESGRPDSSGRPPDDSTGTGGPATTMSGETDPPPGTTTNGPSTSTGPGAVCGDGTIDPGEDCDGVELGGLGCADVDAMFTGGTLACDGSCSFDTSGCSNIANPIVECLVVNAAIPDNSVVGLTSTINLPPEAQGLTIADVDVDVELDHTFIGDLVIDVTHSGTSVILHDSCGTEENINVTYDDEAGVAFDCASSDLGLTVTPLNALSPLDGVATTANWTLFIEDQAGIDTGTLQQWCVTITWM